MITIVEGVEITLTQDQIDKINEVKSKRHTSAGAKSWFLEMYNGTTNMLYDGKPDTITLEKNGKMLFEIDLSSETFWVHNKNVWSVLERNFGLNFYEIKCLIEEILRDTFNMSVAVKPINT